MLYFFVKFSMGTGCTCIYWCVFLISPTLPTHAVPSFVELVPVLFQISGGQVFLSATVNQIPLEKFLEEYDSKAAVSRLNFVGPGCINSHLLP